MNGISVAWVRKPDADRDGRLLPWCRHLAHFTKQVIWCPIHAAIQQTWRKISFLILSYSLHYMACGFCGVWVGRWTVRLYIDMLIAALCCSESESSEVVTGNFVAFKSVTSVTPACVSTVVPHDPITLKVLQQNILQSMWCTYLLSDSIVTSRVGKVF